MKKNKKAFTLVELLVVIAILAILATVSILGYTSFTDKAKKSVAEQELSQIKTVILADWLDGFVGEAKGGVIITKDAAGYKTKATAQQISDALWPSFSGQSPVTSSNYKIDNLTFKTPSENGNTEATITEVVYTATNGYKATWNVVNDTITAVKPEN